jgi:hypothetical protein
MSYENRTKSILKALAFTLPCGAYAIFSIFDAMFWTVTGMSFFVNTEMGSGMIRMMLTILDTMLAAWVFHWRMDQ